MRQVFEPAQRQAASAIRTLPGEGHSGAEEVDPFTIEELHVIEGKGLQAAHEKGIVHRDLRPSNMKTPPEGKVRMLDFGLANLNLTRAISSP